MLAMRAQKLGAAPVTESGGDAIEKQKSVMIDVLV